MGQVADEVRCPASTSTRALCTDQTILTKAGTVPRLRGCAWCWQRGRFREISAVPTTLPRPLGEKNCTLIFLFHWSARGAVGANVWAHTPAAVWPRSVKRLPVFWVARLLKEGAGVQLAWCFAAFSAQLVQAASRGRRCQCTCAYFCCFFRVTFPPLSCAFCCLSLHLLKDFSPRGKTIKLVGLAPFGIFF